MATKTKEKPKLDRKVQVHLKAEIEKLEAKFPPSIAALQKAARAHWNSGAIFTWWEADCRKPDDGNGYLRFYFRVLFSFLQKIPEGFTITEARLDIRQPMPYETYVGGRLLKEGTADGFVGIVGTAIKDAIDGQRVRKVMSRQIGKPFYQYTSRSDLIPTRKPR